MGSVWAMTYSIFYLFSVGIFSQPSLSLEESLKTPQELLQLMTMTSTYNSYNKYVSLVLAQLSNEYHTFRALFKFHFHIIIDCLHCC